MSNRGLVLCRLLFIIAILILFFSSDANELKLLVDTSY